MNHLLPDPFWTSAPLSTNEILLMLELKCAHYRSAGRENISSVTLKNIAAGSGSFTSAIAGALLTLGGTHAPLEQTVTLLDDPAYISEVREMLASDRRVPGWGNSFVRGKKDPDWAVVDEMLAHDYPVLHNIIESITALLHQEGRILFPNPSAYTAAVAIAIGLPAKCAPYLFLSGRLEAWSEILLAILNPEVKK